LAIASGRPAGEEKSAAASRDQEQFEILRLLINHNKR
jgi:hypothetical protein